MFDRIAPRYAPIDTALGPGFYAYTAEGVVLVDIGVSEEEFVAHAVARLGSAPVRRLPPRAFGERVRACLASGDGSVVDWGRIPAFQREVLRATAAVAPGSVASYAEIAARIGSPRAVRAVGTALARNPVPLVVPCHRVVRSDGTVGNYGLGGGDAKRRLLALEGAALG